MSSSDYYPFGVKMQGRDFNSTSYRQGFNGKEFDGETETSDYGARVQDGDLGIFQSIDNMFAKYPHLSPYSVSENNPVFFQDQGGLDAIGKIEGNTITVSSTIFIIGAGANTNKAAEIQKGIMQYWGDQNKFQYKDETTGKVYNVKFDITVKTLDKNPANNVVNEGSNLVVLKDGSKLPKDQVQPDGTIRSKVFSGVLGAWDTNENAAIYSHEFGHLVGLDDAYYEYEYEANNLTYIAGVAGKKGQENYQSASTNELMGVTANTRDAKGKLVLNPKVTQKDINAIGSYILKNQKSNGNTVIDASEANLNAPTQEDMEAIEKDYKIIKEGE